MRNQNANKKQKFFDIITTIFVAVLFLFGIICVVASFSGSTIYLFQNRFDVVLTDSMSEKNDYNKEFLKNYNNQIQPFDLVISKKVTNNDELNIGDIVLFNNPRIGTDMHRIVNIKDQRNDTIKFFESKYIVNENGHFLKFNSLLGRIETSKISFTTATLTYISPIKYHNNFVYYLDGIKTEPIIEEEKVGDNFQIKVSLFRETSRPVEIRLEHASNYDFSQDLIKSFYVNSYYGDINVLPQELEVKDYYLAQKYNVVKIYNIRGDKAKSSDGWFTKEQIYSKVTNVIPKIGYPIRFFTSIWGMIFIVGIIFVITLFDFLSSNLEKDKKGKQINTKNTILVEVPSIKKESKNKATFTNNSNEISNEHSLCPLYVDKNGDIKFIDETDIKIKNILNRFLR